MLCQPRLAPVCSETVLLCTSDASGAEVYEMNSTQEM